MTEEVIDAEVEEVAETALVPIETTPPVLLAGSTPKARVENASEYAEALAGIIESRKLYKEINGKKFVFVEGWTTLGSLIGVFPIVEWTRPLADGWEARVVAKTRDGETVGAAESMCSRRESKWKNADDNAVRSMAQTRATSKALRLPLGFVMQLAGYEATPEPEAVEAHSNGGMSRQEQTRPTTWPGLLGAYEERFYPHPWAEWWIEIAQRALDVKVPKTDEALTFGAVVKLMTDEQKAKLWAGCLKALDTIDGHPDLGPTRDEVRKGFAAAFEGVVVQGPLVSMSPDEADALPTFEMYKKGDHRPAAVAAQGSGDSSGSPSSAAADEEGTAGEGTREAVPESPEDPAELDEHGFPAGY